MLLYFLAVSRFLFSPALAESLRVDTESVLSQLLASADRDHDQKITKLDNPEPFRLRDTQGAEISISGHYHLANLLQELMLAKLEGKKTALIDRARIFEEPEARISRQIKNIYWDGLTRRVDLEHLDGILLDSKISEKPGNYVYVPESDPQAIEYFSRGKYSVQKIPRKLTRNYLKSLAGKHGPLALALKAGDDGRISGEPFVVPGGRFNEMYGWDSYFESLGLIADQRNDLAKSMVDNFVYQIRYYGKILNANRTYYLTRSQPPFLTSMIRAVYSELPRNEKSKAWLRATLSAAIQEYETVWMGPDRLTKTGLSRYAGWSIGVSPEVEPGHFDSAFAPFAEKRGITVAKYSELYKLGKIREPELDDFFAHDQAVRESGHDTTYRWRIDGKDQCANFNTVDLNSLLYKTELDIADLIRSEFADAFEVPAPAPSRKRVLHSKEFISAAEKRKQRMLELLWDPQKKIFFDYDFIHGKRHEYVSATAFYPLWAWDPRRPETQLLAKADAEAMVKNLLKDLEQAGGIAASSEESLRRFGDPRHARQWDFPNGWAPHQMLVWQGLENYGMEAEKRRLIKKWLDMITQNAADFNGTIPEKFDVVRRSHQVFAEYGNVGTNFSYITREGFGWMNASYQVARQKLK